MKKPTLKEKIRVYETLFSQLCIATRIALNQESAKKIVDKMSEYGSVLGGGEMTHKEADERITKCFYKLLDK